MHTLVHRSFLALGANEAQNVGQRGAWFFLLGRETTNAPEYASQNQRGKFSQQRVTGAQGDEEPRQ